MSIEAGAASELEVLRHRVAELERRLAQQGSELERARRHLGDGAERYRLFLERSVEGYWCMDASEPIPLERPVGEHARLFAERMSIVDCSDSVAHRLGFRGAHDLIGTPVARIHTFWQPANQRLLERLIEARYELADQEVVYVHSDGEERFVRSRWLAVLRGGALARLWCTQQDVTQLKAEERARRESQEESETIIQTALDGIVILDAEGRFVAVNDAFSRMTGYTREELSERHCWDVDVELSPAEVRAQLAETRRRGSRRTRNVIRRKDGSHMQVEISSRHQDVHGGRIYCFARDVTQRLQDEAREREQLAEMAHVARLNTMGEMASGIAHELAQPLAAIVNYTRGSVRRLKATDEAERDPELCQAMEQAAAQAERAGEILRRVRSFVRKETYRAVPCSLGRLVREAVELLRGEARQKGVRVELDLAGVPDAVLADSVQVQQVILNLARNAFDAMEEGPDPRVLSISSRREVEGLFHVRVCDTGSGIPGPRIDDVLVPFYSSKPGGMGMGLAICRSIVEAHGGSLSALNRPEGGACFEFTLPTYSEEGAHGDQAP